MHTYLHNDILLLIVLFDENRNTKNKYQLGHAAEYFPQTDGNVKLNIHTKPLKNFTLHNFYCTIFTIIKKLFTR